MLRPGATNPPVVAIQRDDDGYDAVGEDDPGERSSKWWLWPILVAVTAFIVRLIFDDESVRDTLTSSALRAALLVPVAWALQWRAKRRAPVARGDQNP